MILALVCARKGSEGLPGKNTRELGGVTMIDRAIDKAARSKCFDLVVVSTDCHVKVREIHDQPLMYISRPRKLAGPRVSKWAVWQDVVVTVEAATGEKVHAICDIDVSRPLTTASDVKDTMAAWIVHKAPSTLAVCHAKKSPYFDTYEADFLGNLSPAKVTKSGHIWARQDGPPCYEYGGIFVIARDALMATDGMWELPVHGHEIDRAHCFDVDDELDWKVVSALA